MLNPCGSHSPPLAALIARVSETDVLLTTGRRLAHLYNTPPLGAGILYFPFVDLAMVGVGRELVRRQRSLYHDHLVLGVDRRVADLETHLAGRDRGRLEL